MMKKPKTLISIGLGIVAVAIVVLLIVQWDTTKKAAVDAWNGNYKKPSESLE